MLSLSWVNTHKTGRDDKVCQKNVTNRTWTEQNRWQTCLLGILRRYGVISWELIWLFWQSFFWKRAFLRKGSLYLWPQVRQIKCWESGWCGSCVIVSGLKSRDEVIKSKLGVEMAINSLARWVILRNSFFENRRLLYKRSGSVTLEYQRWGRWGHTDSSLHTAESLSGKSFEMTVVRWLKLISL